MPTRTICVAQQACKAQKVIRETKETLEQQARRGQKETLALPAPKDHRDLLGAAAHLLEMYT